MKSNTVIFNIAQANFLYKNGATIDNIVEGDKHKDMGILFVKNEVFDRLMTKWSEMAKENRNRNK